MEGGSESSGVLEDEGTGWGGGGGREGGREEDGTAPNITVVIFDSFRNCR